MIEFVAFPTSTKTNKSHSPAAGSGSAGSDSRSMLTSLNLHAADCAVVKLLHPSQCHTTTLRPTMANLNGCSKTAHMVMVGTALQLHPWVHYASTIKHQASFMLQECKMLDVHSALHWALHHASKQHAKS